MRAIFKINNKYYSANSFTTLERIKDKIPLRGLNYSEVTPIFLPKPLDFDFKTIKDAFYKYGKEIVKGTYLNQYDPQVADAILGIAVIPDPDELKMIKNLLRIFNKPFDLVKIIDFNMLLMGKISINIKKLILYFNYESTEELHDINDENFDSLITKYYGLLTLTTIKHFI